jgi:hypothetical protein
MYVCMHACMSVCAHGRKWRDSNLGLCIQYQKASGRVRKTRCLCGSDVCVFVCMYVCVCVYIQGSGETRTRVVACTSYMDRCMCVCACVCTFKGIEGVEPVLLHVMVLWTYVHVYLRVCTYKGIEGLEPVLLHVVRRGILDS